MRDRGLWWRLGAGVVGAAVLHALLWPVVVVLGAAGPAVESPATIVVLSVGVERDTLVAGQTVASAVTVTNTGGTAGDTALVIELSRQRLGGEEAVRLLRHEALTLRPGEVRDVVLDVPIPGEVDDGPWWVVAAPATGETLDRAAARSSAVWVDGGHARDIAVSLVLRGDLTTAEAGGVMDAVVGVQNMGAGWVRPGVTTIVELVGGDGAVELARWTEPRSMASGVGRTASRRLWLPEVPAGRYGLRASTSLSEGERDDAAPGNNEATVWVELVPPTRPDLVVRDHASLRELTLGVEQPAWLEVVNVGADGERDVPRVDRVVLSRDGVLDAGDVVLAEVVVPALPARGEAQRHAVGLRVDEAQASGVFAGDALPGDAFVLLVVDAADTVEEGERGERNNVVSLPVRVLPPPVVPDEPELGKHDAPVRTTVAWISHEAFERLEARRSVTLQPALQREASPPPPAEADPSERAPQDPSEPVAVSPPRLAEAEVEPPPAPGPGRLSDVVAPREAPAEATPAELAPPVEEAPATTAAAPTPPTEPAEPGVPADADATPTDVVDRIRVTAGAVEVSEGLEVLPARPRISSVALTSVVAVANPRVRVTFDRDGKVIDAALVTSTGAANLDGPILASLYRWSARGPQLKEWDGPRVFEWTILLGGR